MSRATELADRLSQNIVTGHDWPNTNDELLKLDSAAELRRLNRVNSDLREALKLALPFMESESVINRYGFYRPANPNDFHPDPECCSPEEIANHKAACEAYDAGKYRDNYADGWITPNLHVTKAPWGIGSYTEGIPGLVERCKFARAALTSSGDHL